MFDIVGEGTLPRVTVIRPTLYTQHGNPLLLFKRLLLGHSEKLPLILKNNGTIPAQVTAEGDTWGDTLATPCCFTLSCSFCSFGPMAGKNCMAAPPYMILMVVTL